VNGSVSVVTLILSELGGSSRSQGDAEIAVRL